MDYATIQANSPFIFDRRCFAPTILDKINGTSGPPLPPISMMPKWRVFAPSRLHRCLGGEGVIGLFYSLQACSMARSGKDLRMACD